MRPRVSPYLLALLAGALVAAAYRIPGAWPLSFIALVPLLYATTSARDTRETILLGAFTGLLIMGTATSWFYSVLPLPANYGVTSPFLGIAFVTISWLLVALATGPVMGLWTFSLRFLRLSRSLDVVIAALLWPLAEFLRLITFNLLTFAHAINNPPFFSVGFIGWPLMDSESFRQFAFGGIYFVDFFVVLINLLFFCTLFYLRGRRRVFALVALIILLALVWLLPLAPWRATLASAPTATARVAIISINTVHDDPLAAREAGVHVALDAFVAASSKENPDIIVLPEEADAFAPFSTSTAGQYLAPGTGATVIDSGGIRASDGTRPERAYADTTFGGVAVRDKLVLTPQGEYLPALFHLLLEALGAQKDADIFNLIHDSTTGRGDGVPFVAGPLHGPVLFCLEVMDPGLGKRLVDEEGANVLIVSASHMLFSPTPSLELDTKRFAELQAVESGVPIALSVSDGPAYILDAYGRSLASIGENGTTEWTVVSVPVRAGEAP